MSSPSKRRDDGDNVLVLQKVMEACVFSIDDEDAHIVLGYTQYREQVCHARAGSQTHCSVLRLVLFQRFKQSDVDFHRTFAYSSQ